MTSRIVRAPTFEDRTRAHAFAVPLVLQSLVFVVIVAIQSISTFNFTQDLLFSPSRALPAAESDIIIASAPPAPTRTITIPIALTPTHIPMEKYEDKNRLFRSLNDSVSTLEIDEWHID